MYEELSWPSWLIHSGRFTHNSDHPSAASREQGSGSSPAKDRRSTTVLRNQQIQIQIYLPAQNIGKKKKTR